MGPKEGVIPFLGMIRENLEKEVTFEWILERGT